MEFDAMAVGVAILLTFYTILGASMAYFVQKSGKRFIIAGKKLPLFVVGTMLFAQALDANSTLGAAAGVQAGGFWVGFVFPLGLALCLFITGKWFAEPLNRMNLMTLGDFYFRRYNNKVEVPVVLIMAVSFIILVAGNLAGCAWIVSSVFNIDYIGGLLVITAILLIYTVSGGLFSSAATDVVQLYPAILAFVLAPIFLVATLGWDFFAAAIPEGYADLSGLTSIENGALINWAGILALAFGDIVALDFMERVFSAKDPQDSQVRLLLRRRHDDHRRPRRHDPGPDGVRALPESGRSPGRAHRHRPERPAVHHRPVHPGRRPGRRAVHRQRWRARSVRGLRPEHLPPEHPPPLRAPQGREARHLAGGDERRLAASSTASS